MTENTNIRLTPESGNVDKVQYFPGDNALNITFKNNKTYQYRGVPPVVWEGIKTSKSVGGFISTNIKGFFGYTQI